MFNTILNLRISVFFFRILLLVLLARCAITCDDVAICNSVCECEHCEVS